MDKQVLLELFGYLGSFLVIVSMLMTSVVKLRIINTVGSVIFCIYALCIHSYPTAAMQVCLIAINLFSLYKLNNTKKEYVAVSVKSNDGFISYFLNENSSDIKNFFPDFSMPEDNDRVYLIMCSGVPAGIFSASAAGISEADCESGEKKNGESADTLAVKIDYTIPAYRDCSAGKYMLSYLKAQGVKKLTANTKVPSHAKYLSKMGFCLNSANNMYEKNLI